MSILQFKNLTRIKIMGEGFGRSTSKTRKCGKKQQLINSKILILNDIQTRKTISISSEVEIIRKACETEN